MSTPLPPHLVPLGETPWLVWGRSLLRSTGFPADQALALADPALATAVEANRRAERSSPSYQEEYRSAYRRLWSRLARVAREPAFREAVAWQSPDVVRQCLDRIALEPPPDQPIPSKKHRQRLLTVASYLQRYTLKNDTIGFCGPVGWARWSATGGALEVSAGHRLLSRRTVHFEVWGIGALARTLSRDPMIVPWLRPRPAPQILLTPGGAATDPLGRVRQLPQPDADLLALADGKRTIHDLTGAVAGDLRPLTVPDVHQAFLAMQERELALVDIDVAVSSYPERELRRVLAEIPDDRARGYGLARLDELEAARREVAGANGDPDRLLSSLGTMDEVFRRVTTAEPARRPGEMYAGRKVLYEDTTRDVTVTVGKPVMDALAAPLDLVLQGVRWFAAEAADLYQRRLSEIFDRLAARSEQDWVPLGRLFSSAAPDLRFSFHGPPPIVAPLVAEFQRRWSRILRVPAGVTAHRVQSASIRDAVRDEFPATPPRWSGAAQHSPDVMIAAESPQAVARGDFRLVLGEVHLCVNGLQPWPVVTHADDPDWLRAAEEADHAGRRVVGVPSKDSPGVNSRTNPSALLSPRFTYWTTHQHMAISPDSVIPAAALRVVRSGGTLTVVSVQDGRELDILEVLGEALSLALINGFKPLPPAQHRPRVTIDRLVVARESWRYAAGDLSWAFDKDGCERFRRAWAWRRAQSLPQRCFYRVPVEDKPLFVDFSSIALVDILARAVRRTAEGEEAGAAVTMTEMLPDIHETWLRDGSGRRYASELRLVIRDSTGPEPDRKVRP